jgi:uncharacterized protein (DUF2249 family)
MWNMNIEVVIMDDSSLRKAVERSFLGVAGRRRWSTLAASVLAETLIQEIDSHFHLEQGQLVRITFDEYPEKLENVIVHSYNLGESWKWEKMQLTREAVERLVKVESAEEEARLGARP